MAVISAPKCFPAGKGQLLYAKSKVYLHLTPSRKDNISGYLTMVKPFPDASNLEIIVAFIPESDLSKHDKESLDYFDLYGLDGEKYDFYGQSEVPVKGAKSTLNYPKIARFIDRPKLSSLSSYAFGMPISNLFSIQVRPKTTNLWQGSIVIHSRDEMDKLPALFFHDDESPGTKREQKLKNKNFDPFSENSKGSATLYWGGDRFIGCLKNYSSLYESTLEKGMFLVNCTREDAVNFIPNVLDKSNNKNVDDFNLSENFNNAITNAKWSVLTGLASVTGFAKKQISNVLESDTLPDPVKNWLIRSEVKNVNDEFDSANVYLAKWALSVQEEAEKSRKLIIGNSYYKELIRSELGDKFIELTRLEVSKATRQPPISKIEWDNFFDSTGRLQITVTEVLDKIFHSGLTLEVRKEAWLFLLGVFPWDTSKEERNQLINTLEDNYIDYKNSWKADLQRQSNDDFWKDQKIRIDKDIKRTDRELEIFKSTKEEEEADQNDDNDDASFNNPNLLILRDILFSYNELNKNLGYVQGMTDLLSPIYFVLRDESLSFWAFARFMERMERNYVRDLSGMKSQMLTLTELVQFMLPDLYLHLEKCDSSNLFFFFRMLLVWFKREISFDETMELWEIMWTDYYSSQFILFFTLAILEKNSKIMINNLNRFDDILRYINDLSGNLQIDDLLVRSELLFLKFQQMVELIDRNNNGVGHHAIKKNDEEKRGIPVSKELRSLLSREIVIQKEEPRTEETPFG